MCRNEVSLELGRHWIARLIYAFTISNSHDYIQADPHKMKVNLHSNYMYGMPIAAKWLYIDNVMQALEAKRESRSISTS